MEYTSQVLLCEGTHIAICIYDHLYGVQFIRGSTSVDILKGIVVLPPSLFLFIFLFFLFFVFFGGLNGSFYLTLTCPLWDLLILTSLVSFSHFRGNTLYTRI